MATNVSLLGELLDIIFQDNRELLLELHVTNVISTCKRENPILEALDITPDLGVNADKVPDTHASHLALVSLIFTIRDYIQVLEGANESNRRLADAISRFSQKHEAASMKRLADSFPDLFPAGASDAGGSGSTGDVANICDMFSSFLRAASAESPEIKGRIPDYLGKSPSVVSVSQDLSSIVFAEGLTRDAALELFSDSLARLDISPSKAREMLKPFGTLPGELGITSVLSGGALSSAVQFGCGPIDRLLRDGLRRETTLFLEGPSGVEKEVLATMFLREGLNSGGCAIIVSTLCPIQCFRNGLESSGLDLSGPESEGRLIFVDWHSRFTERVTSIDVAGNVLKVSNDLTNLAVAIDMALKKAGGSKQVRLVMDMASTTIINEGFDRVHEFLNSVRAKMKNHSCTGLVLLNPHMHTREQVNMLEEIFDGTMVIERTQDRGRFRSDFRITHLSGSAFSPARLSMSITHRGIEMSGDDGSPALVLAYDHGEEKSSLGLMGIESLCPGGLPLGRSFLIWLPSSMMPSDLIKPVVMEAQKDGNALLLALSSISTESIGEWMSEKGLSRKGLIDRGLLQVVDWYGQKSAKVLGMELDEGVIRTSRDLTHLGVGLDLSLRKISDQFSSLAVTEFISQSLRLFDMRSVYSFTQSVTSKLSARGFTTLMVAERDAHEPMVNAAMEELFDGILDIRQSGGSLEISIIGIRGSHFQSEYRPLTKLRDRLTIDVSRRAPDTGAAEHMGDHGLAARLKSLESDLGTTMEEKLALERRLAELSEKESEYERRHGEMRAALESLESKLASVPEMPGADEAERTEHRRELARLLKVIDSMLENLPENIIDSFAKTEDFKLYERILDMYLEEER